MPRWGRRLVDTTGVAGGAARGAVITAAGACAVSAAVAYRAEKAKGLDGTLRSFADTLACVAAGLALFGVFSFTLARWRRV